MGLFESLFECEEFNLIFLRNKKLKTSTRRQSSNQIPIKAWFWRKFFRTFLEKLSLICILLNFLLFLAAWLICDVIFWSRVPSSIPGSALRFCLLDNYSTEFRDWVFLCYNEGLSPLFGHAQHFSVADDVWSWVVVVFV